MGVSGNGGVFPSGTMLLNVARRGCCGSQSPSADMWIRLGVCGRMCNLSVPVGSEWDEEVSY